MSSGRQWHGHLRPVLVHQGVRIETDLGQHLLLELLDAQALLGAHQLVAVDGVDQLVVLAPEVAQPGSHRHQVLLTLAARLLDQAPLLERADDGDLQPLENPGHRGPDRLGGSPLPFEPVTTLGGAGARLALLAGLTGQGVGAAVQGAGPLLGGAQREPGVGLGLPGSAGRTGQPLALVGGGLLLGRVAGGVEAPLEVGEPGQVGVAGLLGLGHRAGQPLGLASGRTGPRAVLAELLGDRGQGGVRLVQPGQGDVGPLLGLQTLAVQARHVEAEPLGRRGRLGQHGRGLVDGGLDLQQARLRGRPSRGVGHAEQVAVTRDRAHRWQGLDQPAGGVEVVDHGGAAQEPLDRGPQLVGALHDVDGVGRSVREPRALPLLRVRLQRAEQHPGPAEVVTLEVVDRGPGGVGAGDRDGVGRRSERRGDGGLVAGTDPQQRGDGAEQARDGVGGGEQGPDAVLAGQPHLERVLAGSERRPVAVGLASLVAGLRQTFLDVREGTHRRLVLGVEALLAGVQAGDPGLESGVVTLRALRPGQGVLAGLTEATDLVGGRGGARAKAVDLAVQSGEPLAPVGGGPQDTGEAALFLGGSVLGGASGDDRLLEAGPAGLDLRGDLLLLGTHPRRLGVELVGVASRRRLAVCGTGGVPAPFRGQGSRATQSFAQPGERGPRVLGRRQRGQVVAQGRLEGTLPRAPGRQVGLDGGAPLDQHRLVGELLLEGGAGAEQVVGQQSSPCVAGVRLDGGCASGDLGLAAQRLELAPDLVGQVGEAVEVPVGGVELAECLLLALAVLEDAGRLLDEAAPVLGGGMKDGVQLALAHDDVHLAADAGVAEQLLDVEQAARGAVDGVLGARRCGTSCAGS